MSNSDYWEPTRNPFRILIHSHDEYRVGEMVWTQWGGEYECLYQAVGYARSGLPTRGTKRFVMVEERKPDHRVGLDNYRLITLWEGPRIPEWLGTAVHTSRAADLRIKA